MGRSLRSGSWYRPHLHFRKRSIRCRMNILLLSMPDSFEHMPPVAIRMPNGALTSLWIVVSSTSSLPQALDKVPYEHPSTLDAGLIRAYAAGCDPHAKWGAHFALDRGIVHIFTSASAR